MNFAEKKKAYLQLQDPKYLDSDRELLKQRAHQSPALNTGIVDKQKAQREILWALLDVATVDEIEAKRWQFSVEKQGKADGIKTEGVKANIESENVLVETEVKKESIIEKVKKSVKDILSDKPVSEKKKKERR